MSQKPKNPNYYGHKVARGLRSATVWVFQKKTKRLIGITKRTCNPGTTKQERHADLTEFLSHFGIKLP